MDSWSLIFVIIPTQDTIQQVPTLAPTICHLMLTVYILYSVYGPWKYFHGQRFLPDGTVTALFVCY
jgi:hypothetical protein